MHREAQIRANKALAADPGRYQQHINTAFVINSPTDYTVQEPLAQGKKLQKIRRLRSLESTIVNYAKTRLIVVRFVCIYDKKWLFCIALE
jgi:hypothetical protein